MAAALTFTVVSLGKLPIIDPTEYNDTAENAGALVGQTFDGFTSDNLQTLRPAAHTTTFSDTPDSTGYYDTYNQDSSYGADYFEIVAADNSVTLHRFDAIAAYRGNVTYVDPNTRQLVTASVEVSIIQDSVGNSWLVTPSTFSPNAALLNNTITSITVTSVVKSTYSGMYAWREQLPKLDTAPCFTPGTLIDTPAGPRLIEELASGDLVLTCDHGAKPVCWIGRRCLSGADLAAHPHLAPVRIAAGALGGDCPNADLVVSPQHRVLVRSAIAQRMFGAVEVLVAAKQLCGLPGIAPVAAPGDVTYLHLLFDDHELIVSNGAVTESLYPAAEAMRAIGPAARDEILAIFPELADPARVLCSARPLVNGRQGRQMTRRHAQNQRPLVA